MRLHNVGRTRRLCGCFTVFNSSPSPLCASIPSLCPLQPRQRCLSTDCYTFSLCEVLLTSHLFLAWPIPQPKSHGCYSASNTPPSSPTPPQTLTHTHTDSLKGRCYHTLHCSFQLLNTARRSRKRSYSAAPVMCHKRIEIQVWRF